MTLLTYGEGTFVEGEPTIRMHLLHLARAACLPREVELAALLEHVGAVPRYELVRRGLALRPGFLQEVDTQGYDWTEEAIKAYVDGVSYGKQRPITAAPDSCGPGRYYAEWDDGDWRAWERHPQACDLWREVREAAAEIPTPAAPPVEVARPPAPAAPSASSPRPSPSSSSASAPPSPATPPAPTSAPAATASSSPAAGARPSASAVGVGAEPSLEEFAAAPPVRAQASTTCCRCKKAIAFEELIRAARGHAAHFHCTQMPFASAKKGSANLGERIRDLRKAAGLTQAALAHSLQVKPGFLSEVERGKAELTRDQLGDLGAYLGVAQTELLDVSRPLPRVHAHPAAGREQALAPEAPAPPAQVVEQEVAAAAGVEWVEELGLEAAGDDW